MASRYQNIPVIKADITGSVYYQTNIYPEVPPTNEDYYIITTVGSRLDLIAYDFYQDASLWWVIASANSLPGDSIFAPVGIQLRIPTNLQSVLNEYNLANNG